MTQFTVKPLNDIISDLLLNVLDNIEELTDANVGSVLRQMLEAVAQEIDLLYQSLQLIYDGSRVDTATGTDLEQIGAIVGVTRKEGTNATGFVTFQRNIVAPSNFTIAQNAIVSTQPNTGDEQLRFLVLADTTFFANIAAEVHGYTDGIYEYALNERIIDTINSLDGTVLAAPFSFTENTDYEVVSVTNFTLIDTTTIEVGDDCEVADWTSSVDATAEVLDPVNFRQGSNSLALGKSGVSSTLARYSKILGAVADASDRDEHLYFRVDDAPTLAKIATVTLTFGSGGDATNSKSYIFQGSDLVVGWNFLRVDRTSQNLTQTGFPSLSATNYLQIDINTNNTTDTIASGKLNMDYWIFAQNSNYNGELIRWLTTGTRPDDATNFTVDYDPLSREVECNSEAVGAKYNVGTNKIVFKVSNIPNVDTVNNYAPMTGGSDIETDDALRERIKNSSITGFATVQALENAVLAVDGVLSVSVEDLPLKSATAEVHTYSIGSDTYKLDFEVALDNVNLVVTGTLSASPGHVFVNGVDYVLTSDSEIVWQGGGDNPDDTTLFFVDYDYNHLGHVEIFVSGVESPLPGSVLADIDTAVDNTKAAGVIVTVLEPSVITVNVTCTVVVDTDAGFNAADVQDDVETNLRNYINTLGVGVDVYVAELTRIIQDTDGVLNSNVTVPAADVTINSDEVAKAGTISVS